MRFAKYQALGNDYLVVSGQDARLLTAETVRRVCDRHFGVGSDGILVDESAGSQGPFRLRILNPDGSEAEKSGNGLRIFARFLWDDKRVGDERFAVTTPGGEVWCQVRDAGREVFVEMGQATFDSTAIPVSGPPRQVVDEPVEIDGERWHVTAVSVGNPHCVVYPTAVSEELARRLGPRLESSPLFPRRTNVQLVEVLDPHRIRIEIWERGAGYTLASGSSSCAAAAASVRLGLCASPVTVVMPGGELEIEVLPGFQMTMRGPVQAVARGRMSKELVHARDH
jgi:diaminopimelate epimerase